jgi:hypothetical protein
MRNPERQKKASTPRNPPVKWVTPAWYAMTAATANARIPSRPLT